MRSKRGHISMRYEGSARYKTSDKVFVREPSSDERDTARLIHMMRGRLRSEIIPEVEKFLIDCLVELHEARFRGGSGHEGTRNGTHPLPPTVQEAISEIPRMVALAGQSL